MGGTEEDDRKSLHEGYIFRGIPLDEQKRLQKMPEWERDDAIRRMVDEDLRRRDGVRQKEASDKKKYEDKEKLEDCFIASVVYGNRDVYEVNVLREYRDNVLMQSQEGRKFVELYCGGLGEILAGFFRNKGKFLIPIIRKGLDFAVEDYKQREI